MKRSIFHTSKIYFGLSLIGLVSCNGTPTANNNQATPEAIPVNTTTATTQAQACTFVESGFGSPGQVKVQAQEVVRDLEVPWGIAFLPNNEMLVTERPGRVRLVLNGQLQPKPVATLETIE
jgi:glucose/arabinose dehydrogenase